MKFVVLLGFTGFLAACADGLQSSAPGAAPATPAPDTSAASAAPVDASTAVILRGDGVALATGERLAFGTAMDRSISALTSAMASAPHHRNSLDECGEGPLELASWDNGFAAYFNDNGFAGWNAVDQRTAEGIGFGSSREELEAAYAVEFWDDSLGYEFHVDGLSGVLESEDPDARINAFWAGMTCVMR